MPWSPSASLETLRLRADLLARIRAFFASRGVLEVETPALSHGATVDPAIDSFAVDYHGPGAGRLWLHTSPEFPMKRLLAAGSGDIYQLCKVFRDGEAGRFHNPEFTLLEWYRLGFDHHRLMDEVEALLAALFAGRRRLPAARRYRYGEAFQEHAGIDPHRASGEALAACAARCGVVAPDSLGLAERDGWLDLLLTRVVEPRLERDRPVFLYDYPASRAALARVRPGGAPGEPPVAERFELYLDGVELANGFHELADGAEQRRRFSDDQARRRREGRSVPPMDERFIAALEAGFPPCAGVALGVDRLVMAVAGAARIDEVVAFPVDRA
ncbi:EF-P lysine aminoacylase EpmA [Endothiovibrio diazotrophicus]